MNRLAVALALLWGACASPRPAPITGLYRFPATAELHHPVLWLDDQGRFAFLGAPEQAATAQTAPNGGTYQRRGNQLHLRFERAECCQFVGTDHEQLTVVPAADGSLGVLFRGQPYTLRPESPRP